MSTLTVYKNHKRAVISVTPGKSLLELLRGNGYAVNAPCGGHGRCGKCRVELTENGITKTVLACKTFPETDCEVTLPEEHTDLSWNDTTYSAVFASNRQGYGAAADLGTTTVAVKLYRLADGAALGSASQWNVQKSCGGDVITRIDYCMKHADGLGELNRMIRSQIREMIAGLCEEIGIAYRDISEIVLAGNTVMQHIFAGLSPISIASAPFTPQSLFDDGASYELDGVPVHLSPCVAGYVGGDITAGLLHTGLHKKEGRSLFIDVGTNGEMALGGADGFTACAVASGPAFEGAEITCGMSAAAGAVCAVELTEDGLSYQVLGGGEARGLCGSGLLDLVACLLDLGHIDESGCLEENENGEAVFYLTDKVYLTQRDIRQLQLAKAAVAAGIRLLLREQGLTFDELDMLYLAGGFGNRLRVESAVRIGMLPREMAGRIAPVGNAALAGAEQALLDPGSRKTLLAIRNNCRYIELSTASDFNDAFVEEMTFPEVVQ